MNYFRNYVFSVSHFSKGKAQSLSQSAPSLVNRMWTTHVDHDHVMNGYADYNLKDKYK